MATSSLSLFMPVLPGTTMISIIETLVKAQPAIDKALTAVGTVHFARFLLLDRSQPSLIPNLAAANKPSDTLIIAVVTEYDGSFDAYINDFVAQLGAVFDALLGFTIGGAALVPVANHVDAFLAYITANDASQHVPNKGLYAAYPQTVQLILAAFS